MSSRRRRPPRPLTDRHRSAIAALARARGNRLELEELRRAIGAYSTNVILSLVDRGIAAPVTIGTPAIYQLTPAGLDLWREIRRKNVA